MAIVNEQNGRDTAVTATELRDALARHEHGERFIVEHSDGDRGVLTDWHPGADFVTIRWDQLDGERTAAIEDIAPSIVRAG